MSHARITIVMTSVAAAGLLAIAGCASEKKDATSAGPADSAKADHPKGDHPKGDHPKADHPKGEHPAGEHPK